MIQKGTMLRAAGIVSAATILVRLAGLGREMATAYFFGTSLVYDAFLLAFMIPNFFRGILAEGGLNSAFIPVFADYLGPENRAGARRLVTDTAGAALCLTLGVALLFLAASTAAGFLPLGEKALLTLSFLRFTIFYLVFVSLAALAAGVLNSLGHFAAPALAPLGLDLFWLAGLTLAAPLFGAALDRRAWGLVIGALTGGAAQLLVCLPPFYRRGFSLRPTFDFGNPALRRMGTLLLPILAGVAVGPVNLLVDYLLAGLVAPGMVSSLWYANRLMQLPLGVFGIALGTVALPALARLAAENRREQLKEMVAFALKVTFLLVMPAVVFLALFRAPVIRVLFQRGLFDAGSTRETAVALLFYAPGIIGYAGGAVLTRTFYALKDTRTPVRVALASVAVNLALDLALIGPLRQGGIALATSLVGLGNFGLLYFLLRRAIGPLGGRATAGEGLLFLAWSVLAGLPAWAVWRLAGDRLGDFPALAGALAVGGACYLALARKRLPTWRREKGEPA